MKAIRPKAGLKSRISANPRSATTKLPAASLLSLIGNTPLLSLSHVEQGLPGVRLFAKAEWFNPGGSVKDRAAASIIADAEERGQLDGGKALLDASSGNIVRTASGFALVL